MLKRLIATIALSIPLSCQAFADSILHYADADPSEIPKSWDGKMEDKVDDLRFTSMWTSCQLEQDFLCTILGREDYNSYAVVIPPAGGRGYVDALSEKGEAIRIDFNDIMTGESLFSAIPEGSVNWPLSAENIKPSVELVLKLLQAMRVMQAAQAVKDRVMNGPDERGERLAEQYCDNLAGQAFGEGIRGLYPGQDFNKIYTQRHPLAPADYNNNVSACLVFMEDNNYNVDAMIAVLEALLAKLSSFEDIYMQPTGRTASFDIWAHDYNDFRKLQGKKDIDTRYDILPPTRYRLQTEEYAYRLVHELNLPFGKMHPMLAKMRFYVRMEGKAFIASDAMNPHLPFSLDAISGESATVLAATAVGLKDAAETDSMSDGYYNPNPSGDEWWELLSESEGAFEAGMMMAASYGFQSQMLQIGVPVSTYSVSTFETTMPMPMPPPPAISQSTLKGITVFPWNQKIEPSSVRIKDGKLPKYSSIEQKMRGLKCRDNPNC